MLESKAAEMSERFHDYYEKRAGKIRSRQGARSVLEWLARKGVESIILSNHTMEGVQAQLKRLKLNGLIDEVVANPTRGISFKRRNKLEKLEGYLKTHRCKPNEVATIGDSPEEVEIGKKAGIKTIAISQGYCSTKRLKAAKPDFLIRSLKELPAILMRI
ncbi:HAD family hydrolase [Candidatus Micrarchaeota archaeon]|nr:HAD family hydrolase [Candidatus Micrarchaeota archaeon]